MTRLPHGFRIELDRRVRVLDDGAVLIGGAPPRLVHLAPAARRLLRGGGFVVADATSAALARRLVDTGLAHPISGQIAREIHVSGVSGRPNPAHVHLARSGPGHPEKRESLGSDARAFRPQTARIQTSGREHPDSDSRCRIPRPAVPSRPIRGAETPELRGAGGWGAAEVTVVVPVRDRVEGLERLLAALVDADGLVVDDHGSAVVRPGGLGGIVVVDDGSGDAVAMREVATAVGARVIRHDATRGPAAARNAGAAVATTPFVAFLDSDVVPEPGWLEPLLAHFADPAVVLAAPRIVALPPVHGWLGRYEAVRSSLDLGPDPALIVPRSRVAYVPSAALLVRRDALGAGFDEHLRVAEDVDLVLRLHAAGWRLRYEPASRVAHDHRTTLWAWWLRKAYYGTGAAPLALRHSGAVPPMVLSPWSAAVSVLLLLGRPRAVLGAAAVSAVAAQRLSRRLGRVRRPRATAARLIGRGVLGAVSQSADALTRHYWPLAAFACVLSRRGRRTVAVVALAEGAVDWWRHRNRHHGSRPTLPGHLLAHRLDDLAYGTGLWWGALRGRTLAPLRPGWAVAVSSRAVPGNQDPASVAKGVGGGQARTGRQD